MGGTGGSRQVPQPSERASERAAIRLKGIKVGAQKTPIKTVGWQVPVGYYTVASVTVGSVS